MKIVLRAFNQDGYTKDIATLCQDGRWLINSRLTNGAPSFNDDNNVKGGCTLVLEDFPEVVKLEFAIIDNNTTNA